MEASTRGQTQLVRVRNTVCDADDKRAPSKIHRVQPACARLESRKSSSAAPCAAISTGWQKRAALSVSCSVQEELNFVELVRFSRVARTQTEKQRRNAEHTRLERDDAREARVKFAMTADVACSVERTGLRVVVKLQKRKEISKNRALLWLVSDTDTSRNNGLQRTLGV